MTLQPTFSSKCEPCGMPRVCNVASSSNSSRCSKNRCWSVFSTSYSRAIYKHSPLFSDTQIQSESLTLLHLLLSYNFTVIPHSLFLHFLQQLLCASQHVAICEKFTIRIQCAAKKVSPKVFCHFLSNRSEFLHEISRDYIVAKNPYRLS